MGIVEKSGVLKPRKKVGGGYTDLSGYMKLYKITENYRRKQPVRGGGDKNYYNLQLEHRYEDTHKTDDRDAGGGRCTGLGHISSGCGNL